MYSSLRFSALQSHETFHHFLISFRAMHPPFVAALDCHKIACTARNWVKASSNQLPIPTRTIQRVHFFSPGAYRAVCYRGGTFKDFFEALRLFRVSLGLSHVRFSSPHSPPLLSKESKKQTNTSLADGSISPKISGHAVVGIV